MNDKRNVYMMLKGHNSCPDDDVMIGIFEDIAVLRNLYAQKFLELKSEQKSGQYKDHCIQIYEFKLDTCDEGERVSPSFLWE